MTCASCGLSNDPRRRFCGQCGSTLVWDCSRCGFPNQISDRFCGGCGGSLDSAAERGAPAAAAQQVVPLRHREASPLSSQEVASLVERRSSATVAPLPARVTQEDLDRLFQAKP